jgi:LysM repeat protein
MNRAITALGFFLLAALPAAEAQSLRGSRTSMQRQHAVARQEDFTFLRTAADVRRFVENGLLVPLRGNAHYKVDAVSFPYARAAVKLFVERLADQYHAACGEKLVVTSLTRPMSRQPRNSHELSVHPTGMAADLRVSRKASCRRWLEGTLTELEAQRVVEATRERRPSHYHVAIFPGSYNQYVARLTGTTESAVAASVPTTGMKIASAPGGPVQASILPVAASVQAAVEDIRYTVKKGDSLWTIARRFDTTVAALKQANQLVRSIIQPGQQLTIPGSAALLTEDSSQ